MFAVILAVTLYLTLMVLCGRYTAKFASQRGRSKVAWFIVGALFYPLPYLVLALLPPGRQDKGGRTPPSAQRGPAGVLAKSSTEASPGSQEDTGHARGGMMTAVAFE